MSINDIHFGLDKMQLVVGNQFLHQRDTAMNSAHEAQAAKERVIKDFKAVVADTEELLKATANQTGDRITAARARMEESLAATKKQLTELEENMIVKAKAAVKATDQLVHENPWQSAGVAAAVGFLLGMLMHRRD
jgi:ElaB/YqjD/DUF883 family membrane-anchored ribosome-binding protein